MPEPIQHIRLSELNKQIQAVIESNFNELILWVIADITNHSFKEKTNYHYFDLVEKAESSNELVAKISGKAWGTGSSKIREFERITGQKFSNNINVLIRVKVNYHIVFGLSLDIQDIDTNFTIGVLEQQRQATLTSLVANNPGVIEKIGDRYFTRNGKLPLPIVIQRIAVVASKTSAGNEDFRHTLLNNSYGYKFEIHDYHTVVQNDANAQQFLERLIDVFKSNIAFDAVVINRGGGAQTDFLIFDNYKIGLAVARFPIPIITGIGHQKNETIADLMAHTQTKTPTKAAEFIISHNRTFEDALLINQNAIIIKSQNLLSTAMQRINGSNTTILNKSRTLINHYKDYLNDFNQVVINKTKTILYSRQTNLVSLLNQLLSRPKIITAHRQSDLSNLLSNMQVNLKKLLLNKKGYVGHFDSIIKLMNPRNILKKGFAIVSHKGQILKNAETIQLGNEITISMLDYDINTKVTSKTKSDGTEPNV